MPTHTCLNGETVDIDAPAPAVAKFLERVSAAAADPAVSEPELVAIIYGRDNPLLDHDMLPGHSLVTVETLKSPVYHVLTDLLGRKRVQAGTLDLDAARARYTLTVADAADKLGIHPSAVRQAVQARRLPAWKEGGQYRLDPVAVEAFELDRRGPAPRLAVCTGNAPGISFRVKHKAPLEDEQKPAPNTVAGVLAHWRRVAVLSGGEGKYRLFVLEPGGNDEKLELGPFYVRGRFTVAQRVNNAKKAEEAWRAFEPV